MRTRKELQVQILVTRVTPVVLLFIGIVLTGVLGPNLLLFAAVVAVLLWMKGTELILLYKKAKESGKETASVFSLFFGREHDTNPVEDDAASTYVSATESTPVAVKEISDTLGNEIEHVDNPAERSLVIGTDDKGRVVVLNRISSLGIGGFPGTGKTVTAVGLLTQMVKNLEGKVRILVVDPHATAGKDALAQRLAAFKPFFFGPDIAPNPITLGDIKSGNLVLWLDWLDEELERRILGGESSWDTYVIVVVDEFASIMDNPEVYKRVSSILEKINAQARKIGVFAIVCTQVWKGTRVPTDLRHTIANVLMHRTPASVARQIMPAKEAGQVGALPDWYVLAYINGQVIRTKVRMYSPEEQAAVLEPYIHADNKTVDSIEQASDPTMDKLVYDRYAALVSDTGLSPEGATGAIAYEFYAGDYNLALSSIERGYNMDLEA